MPIQCKETLYYKKSNELIKTSIKGLDNIIGYFKHYLNKTKDYIGKIQSLNNKYKNSPLLTSVDNYFSTLRIVINDHLISFFPLMNLIEKHIEVCEKNKSECLECQKKIHKDYIDAEDDYISHSKEIEKSKRQYHLEAVFLENLLINFSKTQRNNKKKLDEEENQDIQRAINNMKKAEKEYIKRSAKGKMFKTNFIDRIESSTGGIQHLIHLLGTQVQEIVLFTMLSIQNSGKEIVSDITIYLPNINKPLSFTIIDINNDEQELESLNELQYEPYKIKSLLKEYQDDFSETELHHIIKIIAKNMIKKPVEYDIELEDEKIIFNGLITKMLTFTSHDLCSPREMKYMETLVQTHLFRSIFLQKLNSLRTSGSFSWPKEHYVEVGKVLAMVLDAVEQENDIETAKNVIILSQTYYFKANEEKIYLQKFIESHPLFESKTFWEEFMLKSIQKEVNENKSLDAKLKQNMNESKEDYKLKLSNIVLSQLVPIADNMLGFNFPKNEITKILESVLSKYPINDNQRNVIFSILDKDSTETINTPKIENEKHEDNIIDIQEKNIIEDENKEIEIKFIESSIDDDIKNNNSHINSIEIKKEDIHIISQQDSKTDGINGNDNQY